MQIQKKSIKSSKTNQNKHRQSGRTAICRLIAKKWLPPFKKWDLNIQGGLVQRLHPHNKKNVLNKNSKKETRVAKPNRCEASEHCFKKNMYAVITFLVLIFKSFYGKTVRRSFVTFYNLLWHMLT